MVFFKRFRSHLGFNGHGRIVNADCWLQFAIISPGHVCLSVKNSNLLGIIFINWLFWMSYNTKWKIPALELRAGYCFIVCFLGCKFSPIWRVLKAVSQTDVWLETMGVIGTCWSENFKVETRVLPNKAFYRVQFS